MTLPDSQKPKESTFRAFENKEKEIEKSKGIIRDKVSYMAKRIKQALKLNKKNLIKTKIQERKKNLIGFRKEKNKGFSKGKKVEYFNY